jgi:signal recognition particle subunit SRP54
MIRRVSSSSTQMLYTRARIMTPSTTPFLTSRTQQPFFTNLKFTQHQFLFHQQQQQRNYAGMFSTVSSKIKGAMDSLSRKKHLSVNDVNAAMHNVRLALLQADVSQEVVDEFITRVKDNIIGQKTVEGSELPKAATVYALVQKQLTDLLGTSTSPLHVLANKEAKGKISVILVAGTQGSGKTTTCAKLAQYIRSMKQLKGDNYPVQCFLVSLDTHRPAAQEQLNRLAEQINVLSQPVNAEEKNPVNILHNAWNRFQNELLPNDQNESEWVIILDTAGRMQVDQELMNELKQVHSELFNHLQNSKLPSAYTVNPTVETLLVADAMLGNEAVNIAKHFHDQLGLSGIVLTRLDGDARGGAAISMRERTGVPIKLIGTGEHLNAIDIFEPKGLTDRIMGQGDVGAFARRAVAAAAGDSRFSSPEALQASLAKYATGQFNFSDYLQLTEMFKKMGGVADMATHLPGEMGRKAQQFTGVMEKMAGTEVFELHKTLITHLTPEEMVQPQILKTSSARRIQIAKAAGVEVVEVNKLMKMFDKFAFFASKLGKTGAKFDLNGGPDQFRDLMNDPEFVSLMMPKAKTKFAMRR